MYLNKNKIRDLAEQITNALYKDKNTQMDIDKDTLIMSIEKVFVDEIEKEEKLNTEVLKLMKQYESQIRRENMDYNMLRLKIRSQLAKEKGIVL